MTGNISLSHAQALRVQLVETLADQGRHVSLALDSERGTGKSSELDIHTYMHHMRWGKVAKTLVHRNTSEELSQEVTRMIQLLADCYGGEVVRPWLNKHSGTISIEGGDKGVIEYRGLLDKSDALKATGKSYTQMRFEECTLTNPDVYRTVLQSLRHPEIDGKNVTRLLLSTNPHGSHAPWWKKEYFENLPAEFERDENMQPVRLVALNSFIRGAREWVRMTPRAWENPFLPKDYFEELKLERDPARRAAMIHGDWSAVGAGMFMEGCMTEANLVHNWPARRPSPADWKLRLAYDHGHAAPFSALLIATAKQNCRDPNGWYFEKGSKVVIDERHSASIDDLDKAVHPYSIGDIASMIRDMCQLYDYMPPRGVADSAIFASDGRSEVSEEFAKYGVYFDPSTKPPLTTRGPIIKSLLGNAMRHDHERIGNPPGLYIARQCTNLRQTLAGMERHPSNPELWKGPDHSWDALCYGIITPNQTLSVTSF